MYTTPFIKLSTTESWEMNVFQRPLAFDNATPNGETHDGKKTGKAIIALCPGVSSPKGKSRNTNSN